MLTAQRLRIVHACKAYLPASENWLFHQIQALEDVDNLVASPLFLPCPYYAPGTTYLVPPLQPVNRDLAAPRTLGWQAIDLAARGAYRLYPRFVQAVAGDVDAVHSYFGHVAWSFRPLVARLGVPHIVSFLGMDFLHLPTRERRWIDRYRILFEEAAAFIVQGVHGVTALVDLGCPRDKITVVPLGVDTRTIRFVPRTKRRNELALLQAADYRPKKAHADTVAAFLRALPSCPGLTLTVVASEPSTRGAGIGSRVRAVVQAAGATEHVRFLERLPHGALLELMERHHVFIQPSCRTEDGDMEGGPVSVLDAQATGMPIIGTRHGDIPAAVVDGETGFLSAEHDVEGLAASISRLYHMDEDEYATRAVAARRHVEAHYHVRKTAALVRATYAKVCDAAGWRSRGARGVTGISYRARGT